jgi:alcohol dehydrogenase
MSRARRKGTRGSIRHYCGLLGPSGATAMRVGLERDRKERWQRLVASASDSARQRRRRDRPRMRSLTVFPGARLRWRDVATPPPPSPEGATVHPIAIGTCDMDCPIALGTTPFPLPLHIGHECVAEVTAVGELVSTVKVGDRVIVPFQISCGACSSCQAGHTSNCLSVPPTSLYGFGLAGGHWGGAYADELGVPFADAMLVPLPAGIEPAAAASLADNVCDAYRHVAPHLPDLLKDDPDAEVLILAAVNPRTLFTSSCPLYAGLIAKACGARRVRLADSRKSVREYARRLGLETLDPRKLPSIGSAALVADISGDPAGLYLALSNTAPDGICSSAGGLHSSAAVPALLMYGRNVTLHMGRTNTRPLIPKVLDLMLSGNLQPELVTSCVASLDEATRALGEHFSGGAIKTVLTTA